MYLNVLKMLPKVYVCFIDRIYRYIEKKTYIYLHRVRGESAALFCHSGNKMSSPATEAVSCCPRVPVRQTLASDPGSDQHDRKIPHLVTLSVFVLVTVSLRNL